MIKIESPTVPDAARGPCLGESAIHEPPGAETSPVFANLYRSVRGIAASRGILSRRAVISLTWPAAGVSVTFERMFVNWSM